MISHLHKTLLLLLLLAAGQQVLYGQSADNAYARASNLYEEGKIGEALETINRLIRYDSTDAQYLLLRANCYFAMDEYERTINDCYSILRLSPNMPEVYMLRGKVCVVTESYGGAILFFGKAIQYSSDNNILFDAFYHRGKAYYNLGKYHDARASLEAAYEIRFNNSALLLAMAETWLKLHQPDKALEFVMFTIETDPDNAEAYAILGRISKARKDFPQAVDAFERYAALEPVPGAYNELAEAYYMNSSQQDALNTLNKSIALDPKDPAPYRLKGIIYVEQGLQSQGCDHLFQSLQLGYLEKYGYDLLDVYLKLCEKTE